MPERKHHARPGIRRAFVCPTAGRPWRRFVGADEANQSPKCPEHNRAIRDTNHPYFGQSTR